MGIERRKKTYMSHFAIWFVSANQPESMSFHNELSSSIPSILLPCSCLYFFFSTTECEMCFELQQGVRVSTSFSLLFSLSLCLLSGYRYHFPSFFLSSIPSLHLPPPTKPVTPPPHHTLFTRTSASTLCRVRAGDEGGSGRFWLTKMLRCNLVQAEMWSVHFWLGVCEQEGRGWADVWSSVYCIASSFVCILYLISAQTSRLHILTAGDPVSQHYATLSLSNNITYLF